jgi:hypothetical protein
VLLDQAMRRHPTLQQDGRTIDQVDRVGMWFGRSSQRARPAVFWRQRLPGNLQLRCCLEVEQGANGVLAHLSAQPMPDTTSPLAVLVSRLAVERWIAHELSVLARSAEVMSRLSIASLGMTNERRVRTLSFGAYTGPAMALRRTAEDRYAA